MKLNYLWLVLLLFTGTITHAQLSIDAQNTNYTIDFTGFTGSGFAPAPGGGQLDSDTWRVVGVSDGAGTFGGTHAGGDFARGSSTGGESTGGVYSFNVGGGNTTLGFQPAGSDLTPGEITLSLSNNTGQAITELEVSYDIFVFNDQARGNDVNFSHSSNDAAYTAEPSLDFTTPAGATGASWSSANNQSITLTGLSIPNGANYYLKWTTDDNSGGGGRDEIALDNVTVKAVSPIEVNFTSATFNDDEGAGTANVTLSISNAPSGDVTVDIATIGGTANNPADYGFSTTQVTFPSGSAANQQVSISIVDDALVEGDETIDFEISNPTNGANIGAQNQTEFTINDNDQSELNFAVASQNINENGGSVSVSVTLDNANANNSVSADIVLNVGSSSATEGADFTYSSTQTVTFPAGDNTTQSITIPILEDALTEGNETIVLDLANAVNANIGATDEHTITIVDNDQSNVSFALANDNIAENGGSIAIAVELDQVNASNSVSVDVVLLTGSSTATEGADFTYASTQTVTFPVGSNATQSINIPITDDALTEGNEVFVLELQNASNAGIGVPSQETITITDNDQSTVNYVLAAQSVAEGAGSVNVDVSLDNANSSAVSVDLVLNTGSSTATEGADFTYPSTQTVVFPPNDNTTQTIAIPINDDAITEGDETITLDLANASNASIGTSNTHVITITDDEQSTVTFVGASQNVGEAAGTVTVQVALSTVNINDDITVDVQLNNGLSTATEGTDFSYPSTQTITFPAGTNTTQNLTFPLTDDALIEANETIVFDLVNVTNATIGSPNQHTVTIIDNDRTVEFALASATVSEAGVSIDVDVSINGADPANATSVDVVLTGGTANPANDFTWAQPETVTFPAGDGSNQTITITINEDAINETTETIELGLANPTNNAEIGAQANMTVNITDNDDSQVRFVGTDMQVLENVGNIIIELELDQVEPDLDINVDVIVSSGTATISQDYTYSSPTNVTFSAGSSSKKQFLIPIVNDAVPEPDENFVLTITNPVNAQVGTPSDFDVTIINEDRTVFLAADTLVVNENAGTVDVDVSIDGADPNNPTSVDLLLTGGSATNGVDFNFTSPTTVTFPAGVTANQTVSIPLVDDNEVEQAEFFKLMLQNATNNARIETPDEVYVEIISEDTAGVSFSTAAQSVNENGGNTIVTVTLDRVDPFNDTQVDAVVLMSSTATNAADYNYSFPVTLQFPAGTNADQVITIPIIDDTDVEGDETIELELTNVSANARYGVNTQNTITIIENDFDPVISFTTGAQSVDEAVGTVDLTLTIANPRPTPTTVDVVLNTVSGTAAEGSDFTYPNTQTITFPANDGSSQTLSFNVTDDIAVEPNETIVFDLANANNNATYSIQSHTVTVVDNDLPSISFVDAAVEVDEGAGTLVVETQITEPANCSASYLLVNGTATENEDMATVNAIPVSFDALLGGVNQPNIITTILEDVAVEGDETFFLVLDAVNPLGLDLDQCRIGLQDSIKVTILDNEVVPEVNWNQNSLNHTEGETNLYARANVAEATTCDVVVKAYDATGTIGDDANLLDDTLSFNGTTLDSVLFEVIDDVVFEGTLESVLFVLDENIGPCAIGSIDSLFVNITDNEQNPVLNWVSTNQEVLESIGTVAVRVGISEASADCQPQVSLAGGTAANGSDFNFVNPSTVNFTTGGADEMIVTLDIIDDLNREADETIVLTLSDDPGDACVLGTPTDISITILRNDIPTYTIDDIHGELPDGVADSTGVVCKLLATVQRPFDGLAVPAYWMHDGTGAILVTDPGFVMSAVSSGDSLLLEGEVKQLNGHTILETVSSVNKGVEMVKSAISPLAIDESTESYFVYVPCLTLPQTTQLSSPMVDFEDAFGNTVRVFLDDFAQWNGLSLTAGAYDIEAFVLQNDNTSPFNSDYELHVRELTDIDLQVSALFTFSQQARTVDFTFNGFGAINYSWDFNDGASDVVVNPTHTYASDGAYLVNLTADNGVCAHSYSELVNINTVGIAEREEQKLRVYPNPINSGQYLRVEHGEKIRELSVYNLQGKRVYFRQVNDWSATISLPETAGTYLIAVQLSNGEQVMEKVLVH